MVLLACVSLDVPVLALVVELVVGGAVEVLLFAVVVVVDVALLEVDPEFGLLVVELVPVLLACELVVVPGSDELEPVSIGSKVSFSPHPFKPPTTATPLMTANKPAVRIRTQPKKCI